jgi:hypothetical protein
MRHSALIIALPVAAYAIVFRPATPQQFSMGHKHECAERGNITTDTHLVVIRLRASRTALWTMSQ